MKASNKAGIGLIALLAAIGCTRRGAPVQVAAVAPEVTEKTSTRAQTMATGAVELDDEAMPERAPELTFEQVARGIDQEIEQAVGAYPGGFGLEGHPVSLQLQRVMHLDRAAVFIEKVRSKSEADDLGLAPNDIVVSVNGKEVLQAADIDARLQTAGASGPLHFEIIRDGKPMSLGLRAEQRRAAAAKSMAREEARNAAAQRIETTRNRIAYLNRDLRIAQELFDASQKRLSTAEKTPMTPEALGLTVAPVSEQLVGLIGIKDTRGAFVTAVADDSEAAKAGLQARDIVVAVGEDSVSDVSVLHSVLARSSKSEKLPVVVLRKGKRQKLALKPARAADFLTLEAEFRAAQERHIQAHSALSAENALLAQHERVFAKLDGDPSDLAVAALVPASENPARPTATSAAAGETSVASAKTAEAKPTPKDDKVATLPPAESPEHASETESEMSPESTDSVAHVVSTPEQASDEFFAAGSPHNVEFGYTMSPSRLDYGGVQQGAYARWNKSVGGPFDVVAGAEFQGSSGDLASVETSALQVTGTGGIAARLIQGRFGVSIVGEAGWGFLRVAYQKSTSVDASVPLVRFRLATKLQTSELLSIALSAGPQLSWLTVAGEEDRALGWIGQLGVAF